MKFRPAAFEISALGEQVMGAGVMSISDAALEHLFLILPRHGGRTKAGIWKRIKNEVRHRRLIPVGVGDGYSIEHPREVAHLRNLQFPTFGAMISAIDGRGV